MIDKKKDNRGGKRVGAGKPKKVRNFSDLIKADVIKALNKKAKEDGLTFGDLLVKSAWEPGHFALKATAMKLIAEILVVKESKQTVEKKVEPMIYLPADRPSAVRQEETQEEGHIH